MLSHYKILLKSFLKYIILTIFFILYIPTSISANANREETKRDSFINQYRDLKINTISVLGLEKTRMHVINPLISDHIGKKISQFDPEIIKQRFYKTGLFSSVKIDHLPAEEGANVTIKVKEKLSLIILPMVMTSDSRQSYGLFLMEKNFLGLRKQVFLGGTYSPQIGWNIRTGYIDKSLFNTNFIFAIKTTVGDVLVENSTQRGDVYQRFYSFTVGSDYELGYKFLDSLSLSLAGKYNNFKIDTDKNDRIQSPASSAYYYQGVQLYYKNIFMGEVLSYGLTFKGKYMRAIPISGDAHGHNYSKFNFNFSHNFFGNHRISYNLIGGASNAPAVVEDRIGGMAGFKTLPMFTTAADYYVSATLSSEFIIHRFSYLDLTARTFWEHGILQKDSRKSEHFYGPGAGLRLYLKQIAMPAFGFDLSYNININDYFISASIGFSM